MGEGGRGLEITKKIKRKRTICKQDPIILLKAPVIYIFNIQITILKLHTITKRLEIWNILVENNKRGRRLLGTREYIAGNFQVVKGR